MKKFLIVILFFVVGSSLGRSTNELEVILDHLKRYEFHEARSTIDKIDDEEIKKELSLFHELLYYAGQKDTLYFNQGSAVLMDKVSVVNVIRQLNRGYAELYYAKTKGTAFKHFYNALRMAESLRNRSLQRSALLAVLEYYNFEIAQNSRDQNEYLESYKNIGVDIYDEAWATLYGMVFHSKTLEGELDSKYYMLAEHLDELETELPEDNLILPKLYFEKGLRLEFQKDIEAAKSYFQNAIDLSGEYPFLRSVKFFSFIQLSVIASMENDHQKALEYVAAAKLHEDSADTLRSNYYINLYSSYHHNSLGEYQDAYSKLRKAYLTEYDLDFRNNTREVNRLNVVLETQQKELANIKLRQNRIWLLISLGVVLVLLLVTYLALKNIRSKKRIVENEKEIQTQKVEKLLKEQELIGIDAMIEGQEKERRRIASDLHDNLGGLLAAIKHHFHSLKKQSLVPDTGSVAVLDTTNELIDEAYQKVRSIAHARNAGVHAQKGLLPAVKNFAAKVSVSDQLEISVVDHGMDKRLDNNLEITIFRIIQELITNIIKHSGATEACVHLTHHDDSINVMVEDNGKGMNVPVVSDDAGMGLYSIRTRVDNLSGVMEIDSMPGNGTTIIIDIPVS